MDEKGNFNKLIKVKEQEIAGALFFTLAAQFLTIIMLSAAIAPSYNFNTSAISDLGVITETAFIFNISLVTVGILNIIGGYLFFTYHRKKWLLIMFLIAGIGAGFAGIFPLNTLDLHSLFALLAFIFFNLQVLGSAAIIKGPLKYISITLGVIGMIFIVIMIIGDAGFTEIFGIIGHGGAERMIVYPPILWLMLFGGYLLGKSKK